MQEKLPGTNPVADATMGGGSSGLAPRSASSLDQLRPDALAGMAGAAAQPTEADFKTFMTRYAVIMQNNDAQLAEFEADGVTPKRSDEESRQEQLRKAFLGSDEPAAKKVCIQQQRA